MVKRKVVYILGLGRSGTTLLDVILGNSKDAFSCGELNRYVFEEGKPYQFPDNHPSYIFWNEIRNKMSQRYTADDYDRLRMFSSKYDYHSGFFGNYFGLWKQESGFRELLRFNEELYRQIFNSTEAQVVIDSSKYSNRALFLSNSQEYEVVYIYLKRNPVQVVRSFGKKDVEQGSRSWLSANFYYFAASMLCHLAVRKLKQKGCRVTIVKHNEITGSPKEVFSKVAEDLEISTNSIIEILEDDQTFKVGKLYYGNRVRLLNKVQLRKERNERLALSDFFTNIVNRMWF